MKIICKVMDWNQRTELHLYHGGGMSITQRLQGGQFGINQFIQLTPLTATLFAKELKKWARAERKRTRKLIANGGVGYFQMKGWSK